MLENCTPYDEVQLRYLHEFIGVMQWSITLPAGSLLRAHDSVKCISMRQQLNTFMPQNGEALTSALAPVLMKLSHSSVTKRNEVIRDALGFIQEALLPDIHYVAADSDILTAVGLYPDTTAMNDNRRFYTPAQSHTYANRKAALEREKSAINLQ